MMNKYIQIISVNIHDIMELAVFSQYLLETEYEKP